MSGPGAEPILLIGIGNELRGDDAAGLLVARRFHGRPGVRVVEEDGDGVDLLTSWAGALGVILVDAVVSGAPPGTLHRFDATHEALPAEWFRGSTHTVGIAEAVELARVLGALPSTIILYGVEAHGFAPGSHLSPEVAEAVEAAANAVRGEIRRIGTSAHHPRLAS